MDFIHEDDRRERQICALIEQIAAEDVPSPGDAGEVLSFLTFELPLHFADQAQDLLPLLGRRIAPEDGIEWAIANLAAQYEITRGEADAVIAVLRPVEARGEALGATGRALLLRYAARIRRQVILENAIIRPFARLRLTAEDLETLRLRMLQRRGLDQLLEAGHAE